MANVYLTGFILAYILCYLGAVCVACPSTEWEERNGRCFLFRVEGKHHKSWQDALKTCKSETNDQGSLTTITDFEENSWLLETARNKMDQKTHIWIGMSKVTTGYPYIWEDLSPVLYTHWDEGEPNDFDGTQNCVRMWEYNGLWDDFDCKAPGETKHGYICQSLPAPQGVGGGLIPQSPGYQGCCSTGDVFAILFGIIIAIEIVAGVVGYLYVFKWGKQFPWQAPKASGGIDNPAAT